MGSTRLALYLIGLVVVVGGVWVFLTQTEVGRVIPGGVAIALMLLLVGIGIMASAKSINDRRTVSRVTHDASPGVQGRTETRVPSQYDAAYVTPRSSETVVDERRYD